MIYELVPAVVWIVFIIVWFIFSLSAKRTVRNSSMRMGLWVRLLAIVVIFGILYLENYVSGPLASAIFNPGHSQLVEILGDIICVLGVAFAIWARVALGRNWGMPMTERVEPELVTKGPYAFVRHPIYTGVIFAFIGTALATEYVWLAIFLVFAAYFYYSAKQEEKLMLQKFPNQYPAYMQRTKMLVPFVF